MVSFKKKLPGILLLLILLLAAFMRLYRIGDYMTFLGDEGRDLLAVLEIVRGHLVFLGPRSSAADFYYGPIYFYLITPFLLLFNYDPVGPAVFIALIGIATVYLIYHVGKKMFNEPAGLFAAGLYAVSPVIIAYSRSSWNPNPLPFVSLLSLYSLYLAIKKQSWKWFIFVGFLLGIAIQLQYLALFLDTIIVVYVLVAFLLTQKMQHFLNLLKQYVFIGVGFIIGWAPFIAFEIKHGFPNMRTMLNLILHGNATTFYPTNMGFTQNIVSVFFKLFARLVTKFPPPEQIDINQHRELWWWQLGTYVLGVCSVGALYFLFKQKSEHPKSEKTHDKQLIFLLFILWLGIGSFLFGFYKKEIFDYYLGFMFPLPFLLVGGLLGLISTTKRLGLVGKSAAIGVFLVLFILNLSGNPFQFEPNRQKQQAKTIADFVLSKTDNHPYNFALVTNGNSDHEYRYYFEIAHRPPVEILNTTLDPKRTSVTRQLLVVCDYLDCQPLGNSLWEVAGFGRAEVAGQWNVSVVKIFKLVPYKGQ